MKTNQIAFPSSEESVSFFADYQAESARNVK
jgi:hypothetical protein